MKAQDAVNRIKELLGLEVKLASMKLKDGTVIEAEAFEAGNEVFVVTEDEKIALPVGTYDLEDGNSLVVEEEGLIASCEKREAKKEESEEELKEEEMEYASKEEMAEVKAAIDELKSAIEAMMPKEEEKEEKEEMSSETEETKEDEKEELSAVVEETRETYHSPESKTEKKVFKLGARAYKGTQDMIFEKLFNK